MLDSQNAIQEDSQERVCQILAALCDTKSKFIATSCSLNVEMIRLLKILQSMPSTVKYSRITEKMYMLVGRAVKSFAFRAFPPRLNPVGREFLAEEDDPVFYAEWQYLEIIYSFFLEFLEFNHFESSLASSYFDISFVTQFIQLFASEDCRERKQLCVILHRLYLKFDMLRRKIRFCMYDFLQSFIFSNHDNASFHGIHEILVVFSCIINGYCTPLKEEHVGYFKNIFLLLLHSKYLSLYFPSLLACIQLFLIKDPSLAPFVIDFAIKHFPKISNQMQLMYLDVIERAINEGKNKIWTSSDRITNFFQFLAQKCLCSCSFQVAERGLQLLGKSETIGVFTAHHDLIYPIVIPTLIQTAKNHWKKEIQSGAHAFLQVLLQHDPMVCRHITSV